MKEGDEDILLYDNEMLKVDEQLTKGVKETAFLCCEVGLQDWMCENR
jgi:hypothetical protein